MEFCCNHHLENLKFAICYDDWSLHLYVFSSASFRERLNDKTKKFWYMQKKMNVLLPII